MKLTTSEIQYLILLLPILVTSSSEDFNCQVLYKVRTATDKYGHSEGKYNSTTTLEPVPIAGGQYCQFEFVNWNQSDETEIYCNDKRNVWVKLGILQAMEQDVWLNCTAKFPLDISVEETIVVTDLEFTLGNDGTNKYWLAVKFPNSKQISQQRGSFSGNYTFRSSQNRDVSSSIKFHIGFEKYASRQLNITAKSETLALTLNNDFIECVSFNSSATSYLSNVAGKNPMHTKLLIPCLNLTSNNCNKDKFIGTSCDIHSECQILEEFHPHGAVYCAAAGDKIKIQPYFTSIDGFTVMTEDSAFWNDTYLIELKKERFDLSNHLVGYFPKENRTPVEEIFYETQVFSLECKFVDYILKPPVTWSAVYSNGTEVFLRQDDGKQIYFEMKIYKKSANINSKSKTLYIKSAILTTKGTIGLSGIKCSAPFWNSSDFYASAIQPLKILNRSESSPPIFTRSEATSYIVDLGSHLELNCTAENGFPLPTYNWTYPSAISSISSSEASLSVTNSTNNRSSILTIYSVSSGHAGEYICIATNFGGEAQQRFYVSIRSEISQYVYLSIALVIITILAGVLACLSRMYYNQRGRLTAEEIKLFEDGDEIDSEPCGSIQEYVQNLPYDKAYEIKRSDFHMSKMKLGEGEFGIVYQGYLHKNPTIPLAVKTSKPGVEKQELLALLSELKIMIYLGQHKNLVEVKGACTEFLRDGQVYIMVEYCPLGSLKDYLTENQGYFITAQHKKIINDANTLQNQYMSVAQLLSDEEKVNSFDSQDLLNWSIQIARGMRYLTEKRVIHGDLATRNVLLVNKHQAKISDFGLSSTLHKYQTYAKKSDTTKLPWQWLAPETLYTLKFTHKSDVWSFGVTLWEIFSLGALPYSGLEWSSNFGLYLENNLRLSKPVWATKSLYRIMSLCWEGERSNRPEFHQLESDLCEEIKK